MGEIKDKDLVTLTKTNHIFEVQYMGKMNTKNMIRKIDKDHYVHIDTGEVFDFDHSDSRADSYKELRKTFKKLRYLINNNFVGSDNELFITLTYAENMRDTDRLYTDFKKLVQKLRYKYGDLDYISVVEPQARGAWHMHVLVKFYREDMQRAFISNPDLNQMWGNGFVRINRLQGVDNIGAYLSAYLCDVELDEDDIKMVHQAFKSKAKIEKKGNKMILKGQRVSMYPPGINIYRKSKGIEFPDRQKMMYIDAKKIIGSGTPDYVKRYDVEVEDFTNTIIFENYNLKREKKE